jgi:hypothetical protein
MNLDEWCKRWNVPRAALVELAHATTHASPEHTARSEAYVQSQVRLEGAKLGVKLYRNNVGAGKLENGSFIRWGLCNDTPALNARVKSGDLVGWRPVVITAEMVGSRIAQFVSREVKRSDWKPDNSPELRAQLAWATLVNADGGDAKIVNGLGSFA